MLQNYNELYPVKPFDPNMRHVMTEWLVDDLWQKGKINGMAGFEKSGKSRLTNWLLVGMSKGVVLNLVTEPQRVLYLCGEETVEAVNQRIRLYADLQEVPYSQIDIDFIEAAAMRLDLKPQRKWLKEKLLDEDYGMLVMDPLRRLHAADEDKSTQMAPILNDVRSWSNRHGVSVVIVHHTPKIGDDTDMERMANWFRGSTDLAAILDTGQYVDRHASGKIQVWRAGRFAPLPPLNLQDLGQKNDDRGFSLRSK